MNILVQECSSKLKDTAFCCNEWSTGINETSYNLKQLSILYCYNQ